MTNAGIRPISSAAAVIAGVGALVIAAPAIDATVSTARAPMPQISSLSLDFELLAKSHWKNDEDSGPGYGNGYALGHSKDDDDEDDDFFGGGFGGGFANFIGDFLAGNQDTVLAVTALIPVFNLGPVAVGNSLLATAYYNGYEGSATGIEGVISYVNSQLAAGGTDIVQSIVLGVTSLIPQFNIGPVAVGNSLLATAFYDGYNGSATGIPGVISYVSSQLGVQQPAPASSARAAATAPISAVTESPAEPAVAATVAAAVSAQAQSRADDSAPVGARVAGEAGEAAGARRASRTAASASASGERAGHAKAGASRSAAKSAGADD